MNKWPMTKWLPMATGALVLGASATAFAQSGRLVVYTSQPSEQMASVIEEFNQEYPDIQVELFRSGTTEVVNKLQAEFAAGDPQPDVLLVADDIVMTQLKNDDRLMPYEDAPVKGYDPSWYDPDMTFFGTKLITTGIMYNTELADGAPASWMDLTEPVAEGQVIMPSPLYSGAAAIHVGTLTASDRFGWDYYEALADNGAIAGRGNGSVLEAVARGEKAYGVIIDYMAFNAKNEGSPVDFVFPEEGVTAITQPVGILATANNPDAAKAFVDWQLSRAAQEHAVEQGYIPAMDGIEPPEDYPDLSTLEVIQVEPEALLENDEEMKRSFADLFGG